MKDVPNSRCCCIACSSVPCIPQQDGMGHTLLHALLHASDASNRSAGREGSPSHRQPPKSARRRRKGHQNQGDSLGQAATPDHSLGSITQTQDSRGYCMPDFHAVNHKSQNKPALLCSAGTRHAGESPSGRQWSPATSLGIYFPRAWREPGDNSTHTQNYGGGQEPWPQPHVPQLPTLLSPVPLAGMQNASALLSRCSEGRKPRGFMVSPSGAPTACRRVAAPGPGSTQPRQRGRSRVTTAGAVLPGAQQSPGTRK